MNRRGQIGPLAVMAMLGSMGGVPAVQMEAQRLREREELLARARMLGVKNPEIHSSHDLQAEIEAQLFGAARGGGKTQRFDEMVLMPPKKSHARSKAERKARRAKRKQRRQR